MILCMIALIVLSEVSSISNKKFDSTSRMKRMPYKFIGLKKSIVSKKKSFNVLIYQYNFNIELLLLLRANCFIRSLYYYVLLIGI